MDDKPGNLGIGQEDNYFVVVLNHDEKDIACRITVPADHFTEKDAGFIGNMVQRAISAFFGYRENEEKIGEIINNTAIGFPSRYVNETMKRLFQDAIGFAAATIFGFHAFEIMNGAEADLNKRDNFPEGDGTAVKLTHQGYYHIGSKKDN